MQHSSIENAYHLHGHERDLDTMSPAMRHLHSLSVVLLLLPLASACSSATPGTGAGSGGSGGSGGSPRMGMGGAAQTGAGGSITGQTSDVSTGVGATTVGATSGATGAATAAATSSTGGGGGPLTCGDTNGGAGCCDPGGVLHYCDNNMNVVDQVCDPGMVCGWSAVNSYYDCVAPPSKSDPSGQYPIACGGGGSTSASSSSSSASSSASTGGGGGTTWTQIYGTVFGPQGTSACSKGGGCHTNTQSGFKCGTTKAACYTGFVSSGWVTPGANASASTLVNAAKSPLCGSLGGNMPKNGNCITSAQLAEIKSWLAAGAQNN
jgi:hypothetical protein